MAGAQELAAYAFDVAVASDVGTARKDNEDSCAHFVDGENVCLVVLADGVSGLVGGATASGRAVETTVRTFRELAGMRPDRRLVRAVQAANIAVYDLAVVVPELRGMATTLTAAVLDRGEVMVAHVGDCRSYLLRAGRVRQLTKDHTVAGARVRMGLMSEEQARLHRDRSVLTRALGRELIVAMDRIALTLERDDRVVLCSDGLYNVLDEIELARIARAESAQQGCRALVEAANARGTADNLTVAILHLTGSPPARPPSGLRARLRRLTGRDA